jgi:hypothetical protein
MIGDREIMAERAAQGFRLGRSPTSEEYAALIKESP